MATGHNVLGETTFYPLNFTKPFSRTNMDQFPTEESQLEKLEATSPWGVRIILCHEWGKYQDMLRIAKYFMIVSDMKILM
jgi:hypothetical protein